MYFNFYYEITLVKWPGMKFYILNFPPFKFNDYIRACNFKFIHGVKVKSSKVSLVICYAQRSCRNWQVAGRFSF
jgi:hypothetical protein